MTATDLLLQLWAAGGVLSRHYEFVRIDALEGWIPTDLMEELYNHTDELLLMLPAHKRQSEDVMFDGICLYISFSVDMK